MKQLALSPDVAKPHGWMQSIYETCYEHLLSRTVEGEPGIIANPLRLATTKNIPLGEGLITRFTFVPDRDKWPQKSQTRMDDPENDPRALKRVAHDKTELIVLARRLPYAPKQGLLVTPEKHPQIIEARYLATAFAFTKALGGSYTHIFNRGGMTFNNFHTQFFKGSTPLWDAMVSGRVALDSHHRQVYGVWEGHIVNWPAMTMVYHSPNLQYLVYRIMSQINQIEQVSDTFDLTWRYLNGEWWVCLFIRDHLTDEEFDSYNPDRKELGGFGALEQSGWVVSVRREDIFYRLIASPEQLAIRYRQALLDMRSTIDQYQRWLEAYTFAGEADSLQSNSHQRSGRNP